MPSISANTTANTAVSYLNANSTAESTAIEEISSGQDTTSAASDPAGMAISTIMNSDVTVLQQAATNVTNGESVLNTASGALTNISDVLTRMQSLAAEAQSGSSSTASLSDLNTEFASLANEVSNIVNQTTFNGENLLTGSATYNGGTGATFLVGDASTDTINVSLKSLGAMVTTLAGLSISSVTSAGAAMLSLSTELDTISTNQSSVGAQLEELQYTGSVVSTSITNLQSASSAITSVDISAEETTYTNEETLTSAAVTAVTDANNMQSELLKVLQG
jgi:flagellin